MVTDISFPFSYASDGDIETVNGADFYEQHTLLLALSAQVDVRGSAVTTNEIIEVEHALERSFASSPFLTDPSVTVTNTDNESLTIRVTIAEVEPFDVSIPTTE